MAKAGEKGEQKANLYLLAIVAIVAVVGIVILVLNSGTGSVSLSSDDLAGEAISIKFSKVVFIPKALWDKVITGEEEIPQVECLCRGATCY
ncbi:MAG: hypothetical protein AABX78_00360, partial [Nanoarchaeota archaeon]